jgi:hypothetical protein
MLSGLKDVDREILKHVDDCELLKVCSIDRKTWNQVCDDAFLKRRLSKYQDLEKYKEENESWKSFFLRFIYYTSLMREKYHFEYMTGDFMERYQMLKNFSPASILNASSEKGYLDLVKYVIQEYNDIDSKMKDMALAGASENGHLDIVKFLLENEADIHWDEDYALAYASQNGHLKVVKYLIEKGADMHPFNDAALRLASLNGHLEVVKYLVQHGADIHADHNNTLIRATRNGHLDVVKYLQSL